MGINRDAVKRKSKRRVKKTIEKIYKDVLEEGNKPEQDKKKYLIGIINEVTKIMQKSDNKKLRIIKKNTESDERIKESTKVVNNGIKKVIFKLVKQSHMMIKRVKVKWISYFMQELGVLKKTSLLRKEFWFKGSIGRQTRKKNSRMCRSW